MGHIKMILGIMILICLFFIPMNKLKRDNKLIIKLFSLIFFFFISNSYVSAYEFTLNGNDTIDKSIILNLELTNLEDNDSFYGLTGVLNYDDSKLEITNISAIDEFNLTYNNKSKKIVLYCLNGLNRKKEILTIKFKNIGLNVDEDINVSLDDIIATDGNKDIKVDNITKTFRAVKAGNKTDSNNYLSDIKINGKELDFNRNELNYEIVVSHNTKKIDLSAISEDSNADINGTGTYELDEGNNEIKIDVTSSDGDTRTYTVNINRESNKSNISDEDLFIKSNNKWNNLYLILVVPILLIVVYLMIKKRKGNK